MRNQAGMSLVEVLVMVVVLGALSVAALTVSLNLKTGEVGVQRRSVFGKIARSLIHEISASQSQQPGLLRAGNFLNSSYVAFDDPQVATQTCFSNLGVQVPIDADDCTIRASYYRLQMTDSRFPQNSDLSRIPLYRLYIRFRYQEDDQGKMTDKEFFVSQFITPVLAQ